MAVEKSRGWPGTSKRIFKVFLFILLHQCMIAWALCPDVSIFSAKATRAERAVDVTLKVTNDNDGPLSNYFLTLSIPKGSTYLRTDVSSASKEDNVPQQSDSLLLWKVPNLTYRESYKLKVRFSLKDCGPNILSFDAKAYQLVDTEQKCSVQLPSKEVCMVWSTSRNDALKA